ncbi:MAG: IPTL-CTERM sorting domain-containing protein [Gammaproteobacteria bacterium]|nr:IPTL-CTERM sorting domain-containing protein [Gammaproteobacteria bacterium]
MRCTVLALALVAGAMPSWSQTKPVVQREFAGRENRFVAMPASDASAQFRAAAGGRQIAFDSSGVVLQSRRAQETAAKARSLGAKTAPDGGLRYSFEGAAGVTPQGVQASPTVYHWLVGDQTQWQTGLKSYGSVVYRSVWPGVDAVFSGDAGGFKYQFELVPGADPQRVVWRVDGADEVSLQDDGSLHWRVGDEVLVDAAPVVFQTDGSRRMAVAARYRVEQAGERSWRIGFVLAAHDVNKPLIIDPAWTGYSGLVGGNADDQVFSVARDVDGNTFACGATQSLNLPTTGGVGGRGGDDAFVVKFDPKGEAQFVTYVGGSANDACHGLALDAGGSIYLAGATHSTNFPTAGTDANNRLRRTKTLDDRDAFVMQLGSNGASVSYSGFIGGAEDDQANAIVVDALGRAYVTGFSVCTTTAAAGCTTAAPAFPAFGGPNLAHGGDQLGTGGMDAFVARVAAGGGGLDYAGFVGGNGGDEMGNALALLPDGRVAVAGATDSTAALPSLTGPRTTLASRSLDAVDAFVAFVAADGSSAQMQILTGSLPQNGDVGMDRALAVMVDTEGVVIVAGETNAPNFPANDAGSRFIAGGAQNNGSGNMDGFIVRLHPTTPFATYLGGSGYDYVAALADDGEAIYATGATSVGTGFPVVAQSGITTTRPGQQDGFLTKIARSTPGSLVYSGFLGTSGADAMHALSATLVDTDTILSVGGVTTSGAGGLTNPTTEASASVAAANGLVLRIDPFGPPHRIDVVAGASQSTPIGQAFAVPLQVQVFDVDSRALSNVVVNFTVPGTGASAALDSGGTATTNATGIATLNATANMLAGPYNVTATAGAVQTTLALTNAKGLQATLTALASPSNVVYNGTSTLSVSGGTGTGSVSYAVTAGAANCSVTGSTVTATGVGGCTITATKATDANYLEATATVDITVTKANQSSLTASAAPATIALHDTSTLGAAGGSGSGGVTFAVTAGAGVCSVAGSVLTGIDVGSCTVTATRAADAFYNEVTGQVVVTVTRALQTAWAVSATPSASTTVNGSVTLVTSGGTGTGAVSLAVTAGGASCSLAGNVLTGVTPGTCTVTATKQGDAQYEPAAATVDVQIDQAAQAGFSATATPPTIVYMGSATLASAGGSGSGAVSFAVTSGAGNCQVTGNLLTGVGVGSCVVTATKAADVNYGAATATVGVVVTKAPQPALVVSATPSNLALNDTSSLATTGGAGTGAVTYAVTSGAAACSLAGATVTGAAIGVCEITATKAGDATYEAMSGTVSISVGKALQTITFAALGNKVLGNPDFTVSASSSSGLVVGFTTDTPLVCAVSGTTVRLLGIGTCRVIASQAGDANYNAAPEVQQTFTVAPPPTAGPGVTGTTPAGPAAADISTPAWVFAEPGTGKFQNAGFIPLTGHPKSPSVAPPSGVSFPMGLFDLVAISGVPGSSFTVKLTYPTALPTGTQYWKYGATPSNPAPHWYAYPGAVISGNTITLTVVDGQQGDDDLLPNAVILDPGGPALLAAGPGGATAIPTLSEWGRLLLVVLMVVAAWAVIRQRVAR